MEMVVNWNVDENKFKKENPKKYKLWRLEQLVNYGGEKISKSEVVANWDKINYSTASRRSILQAEKYIHCFASSPL